MDLNKYLHTEIFIIFIGCIVLVCFFSGCSGKQHGTEVYKIYSEPNQNTDEVASILMMVSANTRDYVTDYVDWVIIDNTRVDHKKYREISIVGGSYTVEWGRKFNISPMIKASGTEKRAWSTNVTLEAGHTYTIHADRTVGHGYKIYSWITDDTLNKLTWGKKYIPGPYDYLKDR